MSVTARLNDLTNVAILALVALFGYRFFASGPVERGRLYNTGDVVEALVAEALPDDAPSLILQVRSSCPHCESALPVYRDILDRVRNAGASVNVVAVTFEPTADCAEFLRKATIAVDSVITPHGIDPRLGVTPVMLLLDAEKRVVQWWAGVLSIEQEREVLKALGVPA